jgi:hypothetical protein
MDWGTDTCPEQKEQGAMPLLVIGFGDYDFRGQWAI